MRSESVSGRARRTARRMATIPYPAPSAPSLALCARPALSMPLSPTSLPLSAPAVLPSLTSFVSYLFHPARAPFPRPCRPSLHDTTQAHSTLHLWGRPCGSTPRHPALPSAPARCGRLARLWGTMLPPSLPRLLGPCALRPARAQCGAIREAALPLCPSLCPGPLALSCPLFARPLSPCRAPRPWLQGLRPPSSLSPSLFSPASSSLPPPPG